MNKNLFFLDAETDGLYGKFLSIAVIILNSEYEELERHYWGLDKNCLNVESEWVKQNVLPILGDYECCYNERELLDKFWNLWLKYQKNAYAIADVCYPVETRLFETCVRIDEEERKPYGPYPLIDFSSIMLAKGLNPLSERTQMIEYRTGNRHNAINDVEITIELWKKIIC